MPARTFLEFGAAQRSMAISLSSLCLEDKAFLLIAALGHSCKFFHLMGLYMKLRWTSHSRRSFPPRGFPYMLSAANTGFQKHADPVPGTSGPQVQASPSRSAERPNGQLFEKWRTISMAAQSKQPAALTSPDTCPVIIAPRCFSSSGYHQPEHGTGPTKEDIRDQNCR